MINLMSGCKGKATSSGWGDAAVAVPYAMYRVTETRSSWSASTTA